MPPRHRRCKRLLGPILALLLAGMANPALAEQANLPDLSGELYVLGERYNDYAESLIQNLRRYGRLVHDPVVSDFIGRLSGRIASAADPPIALRLFVINDDNINAFAMPPNFVGIHTGLILNARTEDELAAVIAHEVSHLTLRHVDRAMREADKLGPATTGAILAALILGAYDPTLAEAAIATTIAANIQSQLSFSRGSEKEADRAGIQILVRAGYDPEAMASFFQRLLDNESLNAKAPVFVRTHPLTTDRIAESRSRARTLRAHYDPALDPADPIAFALLKVRVAQQTSIPPANVVDRNSPAPVRRYVQILERMDEGETQAARRELQALMASDRPRIPYLLTLSELYKQAGDYEAAIDLLRRYIGYFPGNIPLIVYYADMLIEEKKSDEAATVLERHIKYGLRNPALFLSLSRAYANQNRQGHAHIMLSNYYFMLGEYKLSLKELTLSLSADDLDPKEKKLVQRKIQVITDNLD